MKAKKKSLFDYWWQGLLLALAIRGCDAVKHQVAGRPQPVPSSITTPYQR